MTRVHLAGSVTGFVKKNVVMVVAMVAAAITCFLVPPDAAYVDYFDVNFYYHISIGKYDKPCVVETPKNWKVSDKSKKEVKVA